MKKKRTSMNETPDHDEVKRSMSLSFLMCGIEDEIGFYSSVYGFFRTVFVNMIMYCNRKNTTFIQGIHSTVDGMAHTIRQLSRSRSASFAFLFSVKFRRFWKPNMHCFSFPDEKNQQNYVLASLILSQAAHDFSKAFSVMDRITVVPIKRIVLEFLLGPKWSFF